MSKTDTLQLSFIYAYMKKKKRALKLLVSCNVCKKYFSKTELYTHTHVCKQCWKKYVKMTRQEKKELQDEKMG